jgi:hypothetical protein
MNTFVRRRRIAVAKTHDVGKFYWHTMIYPIKPPVLFEKANTQEIEPPYRFGSGVCIRFPFTRASLVFGKWVKSYSESQALTNAVGGRPMNQEEVDWDVIRDGAEYDV